MSTAVTKNKLTKNKVVSAGIIIVTILIPLIGWITDFSKYIPATHSDIVRLEQYDEALKQQIRHNSRVSKIDILRNDLEDLKRERDRLELLNTQTARILQEEDAAGRRVDIYIREMSKISSQLKDINRNIITKENRKIDLEGQL